MVLLLILTKLTLAGGGGQRFWATILMVMISRPAEFWISVKQT